MALTLRPLHPLFGVEVLDVDVKRLDERTFKDIVHAFNEHSVLLFPGQRLTDAEQITFSRHFGPLEITITEHRQSGRHAATDLQPGERRCRRSADSSR